MDGGSLLGQHTARKSAKALGWMTPELVGSKRAKASLYSISDMVMCSVGGGSVSKMKKGKHTRTTQK